eukprot:7382066-Prymnesium_polylepis.1
MPSSGKKRAYMRAYMARYNEVHPERYLAFKRRQVLRYAMHHNRVPTPKSIARYGLTCEELSPLFVKLINSDPCCTKCKR